MGVAQAPLCKNKNTVIKIARKNITNIHLVPQSLNWVTIGVVDIFFFFYTFLPHRDLLVFNLVLLVVLDLFILFLWSKIRWVLIEFIENGKHQKAYFADGSIMDGEEHLVKQ